jgi:D-alanyl-lipoteichoic acid acyltransferase DltB (MBOAT superfamily)
VKVPANTKDYSFRNYVGYAVYAPLYLAGPILTFNDYISQLKFPPASIETSRTIKYGIRFLLCLLAIELLLHFDYCVAISKGNPVWSDYTPKQLSLLSYFNLHVLWLKLLLPWRFFRLWSLMDGIDPPENMIRCLSNNPSTILAWLAQKLQSLAYSLHLCASWRIKFSYLADQGAIGTELCFSFHICGSMA